MLNLSSVLRAGCPCDHPSPPLLIALQSPPEKREGSIAFAWMLLQEAVATPEHWMVNAARICSSPHPGPRWENVFWSPAAEGYFCLAFFSQSGVPGCGVCNRRVIFRADGDSFLSFPGSVDQRLVCVRHKKDWQELSDALKLFYCLSTC